MNFAFWKFASWSSDDRSPIIVFRAMKSGSSKVYRMIEIWIVFWMVFVGCELGHWSNWPRIECELLWKELSQISSFLSKNSINSRLLQELQALKKLITLICRFTVWTPSIMLPFLPLISLSWQESKVLRASNFQSLKILSLLKSPHYVTLEASIISLKSPIFISFRSSFSNVKFWGNWLRDQ